MTIHLPESHYTLTTLITPEDMPDQAFLKAPTQAAQALVETIISCLLYTSPTQRPGRIQSRQLWLYEHPFGFVEKS